MEPKKSRFRQWLESPQRTEMQMRARAQGKLLNFYKQLCNGEITVRIHSVAQTRKLRNPEPRVELRPVRLNPVQIRGVEALLKQSHPHLNRQQRRYYARDHRYTQLPLSI